MLINASRNQPEPNNVECTISQVFNTMEYAYIERPTDRTKILC